MAHSSAPRLWFASAAWEAWCRRFTGRKDARSSAGPRFLVGGMNVHRRCTGPPFAFAGGRIKVVEINIGDDVYVDLERDFHAAMCRDVREVSRHARACVSSQSSVRRVVILGP